MTDTMIETKAALLALAERCEREGPSRELDSAIYRDAVAPWRNVAWLEGRQIIQKPDGTWERWPPPHYTTSIDAAVTLVPEGWCISLGSTCQGHWRAKLHQCGEGRGAQAHQDYYNPHIKSGPLALCAAALRARAALSPSQSRP